MSEPVALPLFCQYCGKPLTVQVVAAVPQKSHRATWDCPWCQELNAGRLDGRVVGVQVGHKDHGVYPTDAK